MHEISTSASELLTTCSRLTIGLKHSKLEHIYSALTFKVKVCFGIDHNVEVQVNLNGSLTLVEYFKFFGENIGEKCFTFCNNFSLEKYVKDFYCYLRNLGRVLFFSKNGHF